MGAARAWHVATVAVASFALVLQVVLVIHGGRILDDAQPPDLALRLVQFAAYFTIQSNLLVVLGVAALVRDPSYDGRAWRVVRTAGMIGISVTGLVHWFLLRPLMDLDGADYVADKLLHLVVPILAVLGWVIFGPRPRTSWPTTLRATVWPLAWLVVILGQGGASGWYPYPFLDHRNDGWDHVAVVCAGILVLWFVLVFGLHAYDRRMRAAPRAGVVVGAVG